LVEGPARVDARTTGSFANFIDAAASLHAVAAVGNASFLGGIEVEAQDHVTSAHSASGLANLVVQGAGVHVVGNVTEVATVHSHYSMNYITAVALGTLDATRGDVEVVSADVDVIASAIGTQRAGVPSPSPASMSSPVRRRARSSSTARWMSGPMPSIPAIPIRRHLRRSTTRASPSLPPMQ
jgi:hypothetical protein